MDDGRSRLRLWNAGFRPPVALSGRGGLAGVAPEEVLVDLAGSDQILQLPEAGEGTKLEGFRRQINPLEDLEQLLRAAPRVPATPEVRQVAADLLEAHAVASIVPAGRTERHAAVGK